MNIHYLAFIYLFIVAQIILALAIESFFRMAPVPFQHASILFVKQIPTFWH